MPADQPATETAPAEAGHDGQPDTPPRRDVRGPLLRFQVLAYVVGVLLLALVVSMAFKYIGDQPRGVELVGPIHGFVYAVYLVVALELAVRARWSPRGTILVLLAGTVPFVSFMAERAVSRRVREGRSL